MDKTCAKCKKTDSCKRCSACKSANYCSEECQKSDWKNHKARCKEIRAHREQSEQTRKEDKGSAQKVQERLLKFPVSEYTMENGKHMAEDYMLLPEIPYGQSVTIQAIGAMNYEPLSKEVLGAIKYKFFREGWPETYPAGKNPQLDYMDDDLVAPATIKYFDPNQPNRLIVARVSDLLWFPLNDIFTLFTMRHVSGEKEMLPLPDVYFDEENQWMLTLRNAAGGTVIYCSGPNKDPDIIPEVSPCA